MRLDKIVTMAVIMALLLPVLAVAAEDVDAEFEAGNWGTEAKLGVNLLQSYYTKNWNGGDKGSIVWNSTFDGLAKKKLGDSYDWLNTLHLAFGQNHQQERDGDDLVWQKPDKTTDEIKFESILRYTRSALDPFVSVRFESQFLDQTNPLKEFAINPMEFYETAGISRMLVKNDERELLGRLGFTFHQSMRDMYVGDETLSESTNDGGIELVFDYKTSFFEGKVDYVSQMRFYKPVFYSGKSDMEDFLDARTEAELEALNLDADLADYTTALDIDFTNTFTTNITKALNVQLMLHWVYDKYDTTVPLVDDGAGGVDNLGDVVNATRKAGQFKQAMSIGLAHTF